MSGQVLAMTTIDKFDVSESLAKRLIENHLAACVNVVGPVRSFFRWKGKVETAEERILLIKTVKDNLERVRKLVLSEAGYELPEFIVFDISDGDETYLNWLTAQCAPPQ